MGLSMHQVRLTHTTYIIHASSYFQALDKLKYRIIMQPRDASQWFMGEMEMTTSGDLGNSEEVEEEESEKKLACDKRCKRKGRKDKRER